MITKLEGEGGPQWSDHFKKKLFFAASLIPGQVIRNFQSVIIPLLAEEYICSVGLNNLSFYFSFVICHFLLIRLINLPCARLYGCIGKRIFYSISQIFCLEGLGLTNILFFLEGGNLYFSTPSQVLFASSQIIKMLTFLTL